MEKRNRTTNFVETPVLFAMVKLLFSEEEKTKIQKALLSFLPENIEEVDFKLAKREVARIVAEVERETEEKRSEHQQVSFLEESAELNTCLLDEIQQRREEVETLLLRNAACRQNSAAACIQNAEEELKSRFKIERPSTEHNTLLLGKVQKMPTLNIKSEDCYSLEKELQNATNKLKRANELIKEELK